MTDGKVEGLSELNFALGELPKTTAKNALKRTLLKGAKPIDEMASSMAPKLTGRLQISVITGTKLTRRQRSSAYRAGTSGVVEVHVGTALSRGMFQEFGTVKMPAHPFMRPAWEANKERALKIIKTELGPEIEKAAARLAKRRAKAGL